MPGQSINSQNVPTNQEKTWLPPKKKQEKYVVFHANTQRMKNSPIIYMQHLLNKGPWESSNSLRRMKKEDLTLRDIVPTYRQATDWRTPACELNLFCTLSEIY